MIASKILSRSLLTVALAGGLLFGFSAPQAEAAPRVDCRARVERQEIKLDRAVARHGRFSRQARHEQAKLDAERRFCFGRRHY